MKKYDEMLQEVDNKYVKNNYLQIMLNYKKYLLLIGNKKMMYYNNTKQQPCEEYTNSYLNDKRRFEFPFSNIPEHKQRIYLKKYSSTNQILELDTPYILIIDEHIVKMTAFKSNDKTYIHSKCLTESNNNRKKIVNREELEQYLQKGYFKEKESISKNLDYKLESKNNEEYSLVTTIDFDGFLYDNTKLLTQDEIIKERQEKLYDVLKNSTESDEVIKDLQRAISTLDERESFDIISPKLMIKIKNDKEIIMEMFCVKYLSKDKYEVTIEDVPIKQENIISSKTKSYVKTNKIKEPKIKY